MPWDYDGDFGVLEKDWDELTDAIRKEIKENNWLYVLQIGPAITKLRDVRSCYKDYTFAPFQLDLFKIFTIQKDDGSTFFLEYVFSLKMRPEEVEPLVKTGYEGFEIEVPKESTVLMSRMQHQYWGLGSYSQTSSPRFSPVDPYQPCPSFFLKYSPTYSECLAKMSSHSGGVISFHSELQVWRDNKEAEHDKVGWGESSEQQDDSLVDAMVGSIGSYINKIIPKGNALTLIDLGCGDRLFLLHILEMVFFFPGVSIKEAICVDLSADFLETAKRNLELYEKSVRFIQGDVEKVREFVGDSSVDVIISHNTQFSNDLTSFANTLKTIQSSLKKSESFIWMGGLVNPQLLPFEQQQRRLLRHYSKSGRHFPEKKGHLHSSFVGTGDGLSVPLKFVEDVAKKMEMEVEFIPESWLGYFWYGSSARYICVALKF
eukprot:CAMPEP_0174273628 /NCGR_PEP_ID=MMETSP0439-20130205/55209_1 /TAXON_ID=0 /ORGANISM="Stereomyxa ramosa, Strain Chinc5" /LENGTH=429 /DNA_ID=CAMNT_0015364913 /DNA_START=482 /DNA_END=1771 /DNA_ORIENTATION=+